MQGASAKTEMPSNNIDCEGEAGLLNRDTPYQSIMWLEVCTYVDFVLDDISVRFTEC